MSFTATYSPDDNKLRLYSSVRLDADTFARVKAAGFKWAPRQDLFVAPMWTPEREDLLLELCGDIGDEDTGLAERAEERAERFEDYSDRRAAEASAASEAVHKITENIPFGQPILVGHHSERHARKDAERIEQGMRRTVKLWETSEYWKRRAAGALRHAKYKELPAVRHRRIKTIEADQRKSERTLKDSQALLTMWGRDGLTHEQAMRIANADYLSFSFPLADYPRQPPASQYEGPMSLWSALDGGVIAAAQAAALAVGVHTRRIARARRWLAHYENRLAYERAMLAEAGGIIADRAGGAEKDGGCQCWASPRGGWSYIKAVNKVSVTLLDNYGHGDNFKRTIPFDKLTAVMSAAEVRAKREAGELIDLPDGTGFILRFCAPKDGAQSPADAAPADAGSRTTQGEDIAAMRQALAKGVKVVAVPQLFPTPAAVAARAVELLEIEEGQEFLEPSGGTGALVDAVLSACPTAKPFIVEINSALAEALATKYAAPEDDAAGQCRNVLQGDFLECNGNLGRFARIVMNPPFANGADIRHIEHAATMLKPGGRLVAICANGPRQQSQLRPKASHWEELPAGSFTDQGTAVNTALLLIAR